MHIGRGLYYGSYKSPRVLLWSIGVIILILMIGTAFLGYNISPKWFKYEHNNNIKNKLIINNLVQTHQIDILNKNKLKINLNLIAKRYNSTLSINSSILRLPIQENYSKELLGFLKYKNLNPIYIYESLHLDFIKKKILSETKGLSGIYLILNKVTLDYYIGSASTNKINFMLDFLIIY